MHLDDLLVVPGLLWDSRVVRQAHRGIPLYGPLTWEEQCLARWAYRQLSAQKPQGRSPPAVGGP